jgi:hypothetical protein
MDDAEYGAGRAQRHGQREHDSRRKTGLGSERPQRDSDVSHYSVLRVTSGSMRVARRAGR